MSGPWIGTQVLRVPQAPHLSSKTPALWHAVNFHTSHLDPTHPRLTSIAAPILRICIQLSSSSPRILSYYWRQDGRRALSRLGGASLGYFQCLLLIRSLLAERKHFLYPTSSQTTCGLETQSVTNPCACSYISGSQLGRWCSPSVWRHFSWPKIAGGEWKVATGL